MSVQSTSSVKTPQTHISRPVAVVKKAAEKAYNPSKTDQPLAAKQKNKALASKNTLKSPKTETSSKQQQGIETYAALVKRTRAQRIKTRFDLLL